MPISPVLNRTWASAVLTILLDDLDVGGARAARGNPFFELRRAAVANDQGQIARVLQERFGYPHGVAVSMAAEIDAVAL